MAFWHRARRESDLDAEIQAHLDMAAGDLAALGRKSGDARFEARRDFGNEGLVKEATRETWGWSSVGRFARDCRFGVRTLRKNPGFSAVVILTLAMGIGANTAIFSVVDAALRPLAVAHADRTVAVWTGSPRRDWHQFPVSPADYLDWKASGIFSALSAFDDEGVNLRLGDRSERVSRLRVTPELFAVLPCQPQLGRLFTERDAMPGQDQVAILSDGMWRTRFGSDPNVVGKTVYLDGSPHVIAGVLPASYPRLSENPIFTPLWMGGALGQVRGSRHYSVIGRLAEGVSFPAAERRMSDLSRRLQQQYPKDDEDVVAELQPLEEAYVQDAHDLVLTLFGAVGFVLLIACANIASLALARGASRSREMTVRAALGASRWQLARQLLAEGLLLSLIGGMVAILPACGAMSFIRTFKLDALPNPQLITLHWSVLAFNLALALATGVLFGLVPAWQVRSIQVHDTLKASSRSIGGASHQRMRAVLVVGEIALTLVLLAGAGLMLRTFLQLRNASPGYDSHGLLSMRVALSDRQYPEGAKQAAFYGRVLDEASALPGVRRVAAINGLPGNDQIHGAGLRFPERPNVRESEVPIVLYASVLGGYFDVMRIPLIRGRVFDASERVDSMPVAVIDEWTARRYWPNQDALGKSLKLGTNEPARLIVGIVGTVEQGAAIQFLKGRAGQVYIPGVQQPKSDMTLVVCADGDPANLAVAIHDLVRRIDVDQPVFEVNTVEEFRAASCGSSRLAAVLLSAFALIALLLAALGVYGVMAYNVGQRTREFGIRMSLGARPGDVAWMVARKGLILAMAGVALGLAGALALTRSIQSLLVGVAAADPLVFSAVTVVLAAVTLAAGYFPARRATRVDTVLALRDE